VAPLHLCSGVTRVQHRLAGAFGRLVPSRGAGRGRLERGDLCRHALRGLTTFTEGSRDECVAVRRGSWRDGPPGSGAMGRPVWRGGCIIRATFLNLITEAYDVVCIDWLLASPPPPITKAEMDAHRKELELMGTSGGLHH
jgi:hypothetical protein